ncbi:MAG: fatty acid hydroxylase [Saprospiraceae bacterium]
MLNLLITLAAAAGMEFVAWFAHKYIMHGLLWKWHEDHHKPDRESGSFWEKNDRFFLVFATPGIACLAAGSFGGPRWLFFVGLGITIYGAIYFLIHDVYVHRRFKWFKHLDNRYSRAILRAHGAHHAKTTKEGCESFGLLVVDSKFFKKRRK